MHLGVELLLGGVWIMFNFSIYVVPPVFPSRVVLIYTPTSHTTDLLNGQVINFGHKCAEHKSE